MDDCCSSYLVCSAPSKSIFGLLISIQKEIELVLGLGATPDKIIFAHPYKQESHLRVAKEKGVRLMTFDTKEELYKIKRVHPEAE